MLAPAAGRTTFASVFAAIVAVAGSAVALAFFLRVDLGGTVTGTTHPLSLVFAAVWAGPFWIYARVIHTRTAAVVGGAALLAATTALLASVFRDTHSTAGIGLVTGPVLTYPLAAGIVALDGLVLARRSGRGQVLRMMLRRVLAVALVAVVAIGSISTVAGIVVMLSGVGDRDIIASVISLLLRALVTVVGAISVKRLWEGASATSPSTRSDS